MPDSELGRQVPGHRLENLSTDNLVRVDPPGFVLRLFEE